MRKTWLILVNSLQRMRLVLGAALAAGILICAVTALFSSLTPNLYTTIKVGYIDSDGSALTQDFERYAGERLGMELVKGDAAFLENELVEKRISAIVEAPAGLQAAVLAGSEGALQVTYMDDYLNKVFLQNYLELYMGSVALLAPAAHGDAHTLATLLDGARLESAPVTTVSLDEQRLQRDAGWMAFLIGAGFFAYISALLVITIANIIFEDRKNHTFSRVQATGVSALAYVVGVCAAAFVVISAMTVVFLVYCAASGTDTMVPLGVFGVLCSAYVLFCVGFALVCGLFFESRQTIQWVVITVSTLCTLLGGAWFPLSYSPQFMQQLAHFTPQFWFMDAFYQAQAGSTDAWLTVTPIILLFALLCFLLSGIRFVGNRSNARM